MEPGRPGVGTRGCPWHRGGHPGGTANMVGPLDRPHELVRAAGKWTLRLLGLFNPLMREMVEMHHLLTEPLIMDDSALQGLIGPVVKTPYPDFIRQTLAVARLPAAAGH